MTSPRDPAPPAGRVLVSLALLWLSGLALRMTILAMPPLIPLIHDDLHMSQTAVGVVVGLPPVLFAFAAVPGSLLIARLGALPTLVIGLLVTGIGSALRAPVDSVVLLCAATVVTAFGVAVMQPALPPLVRVWTPHRVGFATAVYTNGLLVGEIVAVALTLPFILPLMGGSWRLAFVAWGVPCVLIGLLVLAFAPRAQPTTVIAPGPRRWWPDWNRAVIWRLGIMLGTANAMYFVINGFIPDYLHRTGQGDLVGPTLTALNVGQLPASALLLVYVSRWMRQVWPYFVCGGISLVSLVGMLFGHGIVVVIAATGLGFATAAVLILMLSLPPQLAPADDVHRLTAAMFTISYSCAVIVPILSGLLWDLTGLPITAFLPPVACAVLLMALAPSIRPPAEA